MKLINYYNTRWSKVKDCLDPTVDLTDIRDPYIDIKKENPIMVVGESPGVDEVKSGEPVCGLTGKNLNNLIQESGLNRKTDFLITNAMPYRTFSMNTNVITPRSPTSDELKIGSMLLEQELIIVKPSVILVLGNAAKNSLKYIPDLYKPLKILRRGGFMDINLFGFHSILTHTWHTCPLVYNRPTKYDELKDYFKNTLPTLFKK